MLSCIVIDDEEHAIRLLKGHIEKTSFLKLLFTTNSSVEGLDFINQNDVDLIFMDIHMPHLTGLELVRLIPTKNKIIFTTAFSDYALNAFEEGVLDYLLKPISYERFLKSVQKVMHLQQQKKEQTANEIYVKGDAKGKMIKINLDNILYIEGLKNYMAFHTNNAHNPIIALLTFKELEDFLPPSFIRIHKSFIVSLPKIMGIDGNEVIIKTEKKEVKIPLGGTYRDNFISIISQRSIGKGK